MPDSRDPYADALERTVQRLEREVAQLREEVKGARLPGLQPTTRGVAVPNAAEIIPITFGGKTFRTCRFCAAHLEWTQAQLDRERPGKWLRIIQPCWNVGVAASEGTHDKCAVFDVEIVGMDWYTANHWLRGKGWWGWVRTPSQGFPWHIHTISAGCPAPKGIYVPGQIEDAQHHSLGLAGLHMPGNDPECFTNGRLTHRLTTFDYDAWLEENMGYRDWDQADKDALVNDIVNGILRRSLYAKEDRTVADVLREMDSTGDKIRADIKQRS